jgi:outer membrane protein OmpA-like peptidoglycan-associated protein
MTLCRAFGAVVLAVTSVGHAAVLASGNAGTPTSQNNAPSIPDLDGEWVCQAYCPAGGEGKTAHIVQHGMELRFTNEGGQTSDGRLQDDLRTVVATAWNGLQGALDDRTLFLRWRNGTIWTKVVASGVLAASLNTAGKIDIYSILFDVDKTDIKPQSQSTLREISGLLKSDAKAKLEIAGHTDNTGTATHNLTLSKARAAAIVQALVTTYGVDPSRLKAAGYGDTKPVAPNDNEESRAKNRRVELRKL